MNNIRPFFLLVLLMRLFKSSVFWTVFVRLFWLKFVIRITSAPHINHMINITSYLEMCRPLVDNWRNACVSYFFFFTVCSECERKPETHGSRSGRVLGSSAALDRRHQPQVWRTLSSQIKRLEAERRLAWEAGTNTTNETIRLEINAYVKLSFETVNVDILTIIVFVNCLN